MGKFTFFPLLLSLLVLLLAYPFFDKGTDGIIFALFFTLILFAAFYAIHDDPFSLIVAISFGVPWIFFEWLILSNSSRRFFLLSLVFAIIFFGFLISILVVRVAKARRVTGNILLGAIAIYLLMGVAWTSVYMAIDFFHPDSFSINALNVKNSGHVVDWHDLLFFSFSTLTTLGYGDISPVSNHARSFAALEVTGGLLYLTILLSHLVGLYHRRGAESS